MRTTLSVRRKNIVRVVYACSSVEEVALFELCMDKNL